MAAMRETNMVIVKLIAGLGLLAWGVGSALAAGTLSVPTELDFDQCTTISSNDFGTVRACPGYKGIPVMISDNNGRYAVSFGLTSTVEPAAKQPLPRPGYPDGAIVWRLANPTGKWAPVAAIVRYALDAGEGGPAEVLTVTRLGEGKTCVVGYVDATASTDAALPVAEMMADKSAAFDCSKPPEKAAGFKAW